MNTHTHKCILFYLFFSLMDGKLLRPKVKDGGAQVEYLRNELEP